MTGNESRQSVSEFLIEAFGPLNDAQLRRRKDDLLRRAAMVTAFGWHQFRYQWSSGEVLGTVLVLRDHAEMLRWKETEDSIQARWAFDLWGIAGGQADVDAGSPTTVAWFESIRVEFATKQSASTTSHEEVGS